MEADRIKVNLSRTINLGNYESIKIEVGLETSVMTEINSINVIEDISERLQTVIVAESKKFKRAVKPRKV